MNKYDIQAKKFLTDTQTAITCRFTGRKKHFDDDTQTRNCYNVEISRRIDGHKPIKRIFIDYGDSIINSDKGSKPRNYDILSCLTKYDPESFEDFCNSYGYEIDSIRALKTYKSVKKEWKDIKSIWTDEEIDRLSEIN